MDDLSLKLVPIATVIVVLVAALVFARRRGYPLGGDVVVRCRAGHLFTTVWIPFASFKAVRLGPVRFQHCPVGAHWTFVMLMRDADLTDLERREAALHHDLPLP